MHNLENPYKQYEKDFYEVGENLRIFITKELSENELRDEWAKLRNDIAFLFQENIESSFERWNFYIFYVVEDKQAINADLINEIEHNTQSSRKIVLSKNKVNTDLLEYIENTYFVTDFKQFGRFLDNSRSYRSGNGIPEILNQLKK